MHRVTCSISNRNAGNATREASSKQYNLLKPAYGGNRRLALCSSGEATPSGEINVTCIGAHNYGRKCVAGVAYYGEKARG